MEWKEEVHPGDVVQFAPGEKHWHGATATTAMSHIAIQSSRVAGTRQRRAISEINRRSD